VCLLHNLPQRVNSWLAAIFLLIGIPAVIFFAIAVPPFQVPDELVHLFRADQISHGAIIGTRLDDKSSGGYVASSYRLLFQAVTTADSARFAEAYRIPLTNQLEFQNFSNTVQYGPAMYAPQATALALARIAKMTALQSFYLARFFNGFAALAVGFFAIHIATRGRFIIFTLLTMPTSFYLMGSLSQDALLLAGSALFWSIVSNNLSTGRIPSPSIILGLAALLVVLSCGRLPISHWRSFSF